MSSISRWLDRTQGIEMVQFIMNAREKKKRTSTENDIKEMEKKKTDKSDPNLAAQVEINTTRSSSADTAFRHDSAKVDIRI